MSRPLSIGTREYLAGLIERTARTHKVSLGSGRNGHTARVPAEVNAARARNAIMDDDYDTWLTEINEATRKDSEVWESAKLYSMVWLAVNT